MHAAARVLIDVAQRCAAVGLHAAQAYNQAQSKLDLDLVLTQERLSTTEGTRQSRQVLTELRRLTETHKSAYATIVLAATAELRAAITEMPMNLQGEYNTGLVASINWQLNAQSASYATREQWLDAAEAVCELIDSKRETCTFSEEGVRFESDADLARFSELLGVIEQAHQSEVAAVKERLERFGRAATLLAQPPTA